MNHQPIRATNEPKYLRSEIAKSACTVALVRHVLIWTNSFVISPKLFSLRFYIQNPRCEDVFSVCSIKLFFFPFSIATNNTRTPLTFILATLITNTWVPEFCRMRYTNIVIFLNLDMCFVKILRNLHGQTRWCYCVWFVIGFFVIFQPLNLIIILLKPIPIGSAHL